MSDPCISTFLLLVFKLTLVCKEKKMCLISICFLTAFLRYLLGACPRPSGYGFVNFHFKSVKLISGESFRSLWSFSFHALLTDSLEWLYQIPNFIFTITSYFSNIIYSFILPSYWIIQLLLVQLQTIRINENKHIHHSPMLKVKNNKKVCWGSNVC